MSEDLKRMGMDSGSSGRATFPSVNAGGTRPLAESREGGNGTTGRMGEVRATGIVATGRFGGSRNLTTGAQRNPIGRGRERGR